VKKKEALTQEALGFVKKVEDELGIPVVYVGTGEDVMDTVCF